MMSSNPVLRDIQQDAPAARCQNNNCQGEIWREECRYFWNGKWVCLDCFKEAVTALLDNDPNLVALEMQVDVERYI